MTRSTLCAKITTMLPVALLLLVPLLMAAQQTKPAAPAEMEFCNRLACVINADGTIARGFMIEKSEMRGVGDYVITWKLPLQGDAKTNFSGTIGSAMDEGRGAGPHHRGADGRQDADAGADL
jgi:hypothetical protein